MTVWFITGASRGFGLEITKVALERGDSVVATARNPQSVIDALPDAGARLLAVELDVHRPAQITAAVDAAIAKFGRIDVLINNAGRGLLGAVEEASDAAVRAVYDTNVFGTLNVLRAVLPTMRDQRGGRIINLSSIGGFTGSAGWGIYNSTKFAVEGISEALAKEVAPLGILVTIVEPGYFRTDFLDGSSLHTEATVIADYAETAGAMRLKAGELNHEQPGDPVRAVEAIMTIAESVEPPLRIQLGSDAFASVADKLAAVGAEQRRWHDLAVSTDFADT